MRAALFELRRALFSGPALLRFAFLMLGAALALAFALLDVTLAMAIAEHSQTIVGVLFGLAFALLAVGVVGAVPPVRHIEAVAAESMLGVDFAGGLPGPARRTDDQLRSVTWLWAHLIGGGVVGFGSSTIVASAIELVAAPWSTPGRKAVPWFDGVRTTGGAMDWLLLVVGPLLLLGILVLSAIVAAVMRALAPALLGSSAEERIGDLQRHAEQLTERNRLAREIHDSVGHALGLVTVQAAAARRVQGRDPEFVSDALAAIETASRRAAAELDHVLALLREDETTPDETSADGTQVDGRHPVPDLRQLPDLVAASRRAGLRVGLETELPGGLETLPPIASRELYRIAQEGLANALRHGGKGTSSVSVRHDGSRLVLDVTNPVGDGRTRGGGRGIPGMIERVRHIGGTATAEARDGRWHLTASLPWNSDQGDA